VSVDLAITGGALVTPDGLRNGTLLVAGGKIAGIAAVDDSVDAAQTIDATGQHILPGLIDIHCHIRAPAYPQRGTVASETRACAAGGITTVFEMPITNPCCNTPAQVVLRRDHFAASAHVDFGLYGAPLSLTEVAVDALADSGIIAFKIFTTPAPPGREVEFAGLAWPNEADQFRALQLIARTGLPVVVHAESAEILAAAPQLDPTDGRSHGLARPPLAEALAVAKLLTMNITAQAKLHIAHVTSAATIDILRRFSGTSDFTAETCPHYLRYTEEDVVRVGVAAKINPPIRRAVDRAALWRAIADGVITHVTTDHAGFSAAEKAAHADNFLTAPPGHPGTECMLPAMLDAVAQGKVALEDVMRLLCMNAATRFGLSDRGALVSGRKADLIMVDMDAQTRVTETSLITAAAPVARLSHDEVFRGKLSRSFLAGQTIWDSTPTGLATGRFVTPKGPQ
jgi:dihydroorotase (multifunctional complex type)